MWPRLAVQVQSACSNNFSEFYAHPKITDTFYLITAWTQTSNRKCGSFACVLVGVGLSYLSIYCLTGSRSSCAGSPTASCASADCSLPVTKEFAVDISACI